MSLSRTVYVSLGDILNELKSQTAGVLLLVQFFILCGASLFDCASFIEAEMHVSTFYEELEYSEILS